MVELNSATDKYNCFEINDTKKIDTTCNDEFKTLNTHNISFTQITQELLFDGEVDKFTQFIHNEL